MLREIVNGKRDEYQRAQGYEGTHSRRSDSDTGMAFQRTRMAADRTLMGVIRTPSIIAFGFTIFEFFNSLRRSEVLKSSACARNFGLSLVLLGTTRSKLLFPSDTWSARLPRPATFQLNDD